MRPCLFLLTVSVLPAIAQTETNIACVERLEIPAYPALPKEARIAGVLTATVLIGPEASIEQITSDWNSPSTSGYKRENLFLPAVEKSLRRSTFTKSCAGRKVTLVFNFVLSENPRLQETTSFFGYPNRFWIAAPMMLVQP
jgi:hypothetical protein